MAGGLQWWSHKWYWPSHRHDQQTKFGWPGNVLLPDRSKHGGDDVFSSQPQHEAGTLSSSSSAVPLRWDQASYPDPFFASLEECWVGNNFPSTTIIMLLMTWGEHCCGKRADPDLPSHENLGGKTKSPSLEQESSRLIAQTNFIISVFLPELG